MRFNKLDLNLLVALDALLTERSITRAALKLNLSPSAMSNALARLRDYFDDELLVQIGRRMEITPRAASLQDQVRDVLLRVDSTIATKPAFDPSTSDRAFRLYASDYAQMVLAPHLLTIAREQRCSASFEFLAPSAHPHRDLERGEADLLVIPSAYLSREHPSTVLYREESVCVVWRGSPLAKGEWTFERYLKSCHVQMRPTGAQGDAFDLWFVQRFGAVRRCTVFTFSFTAIPALVTGTDLIATVPARLAKRLAQAWPLDLRPFPAPAETLEECMQWHQYRGQDVGLHWLQRSLVEAVQRMDLPADLG